MPEERQPSNSGRWRKRLGFGLTGAARENARLGRLMVIPAIAFTAVLVIYPMILGFGTSVHEGAGTIGTASPFVGAQNYTEVIQQPSVGSSTVQTIWYLVVALTLEVVFGLTHSEIGRGVEAGISIVLLGVVLDRLTQSWANVRSRAT